MQTNAINGFVIKLPRSRMLERFCVYSHAKNRIQSVEHISRIESVVFDYRCETDGFQVIRVYVQLVWELIIISMRGKLNIETYWLIGFSVTIVGVFVCCLALPRCICRGSFHSKWNVFYSVIVSITQTSVWAIGSQTIRLLCHPVDDWLMLCFIWRKYCMLHQIDLSG